MTSSLFAPGGTLWFARHELLLSKRDFMAMMTAGRPDRERRVVLFALGATLVLHLLAWSVISPALQGETGSMLDRLILVTGLMALPFSLMASQAMESVTRVFYTRSDLDLMLASPAPIRKVFAVKIGAIAFSTASMSLLLAAPAINMLALLDHPGWLAAYPVAYALSVVATVLALALTMAMFRLIGARKTRTIAQIVAALVGATFVIGIQLAAIASMGSLSRMSFLQSESVRAVAPDETSWLWMPAKAAMGDATSLTMLLAVAAAFFAAAMIAFSGNFGERVLAATGLSETGRDTGKSRRGFRGHSVASALRHKEWRLLARDRWLISQTLMQVFYLVPPAFMLWQGFGGTGGLAVVILPVLVMATGQLAGGLAWLAVSGEDAPQLVATAPVPEGSVIRATVEAVLSVIALLVAPLAIAPATSPRASASA